MAEYTKEQLFSALRKADAANDQEAAIFFAKKIKELDSTQAQGQQTDMQAQQKPMSVSEMFNKNIGMIQSGQPLFNNVQPTTNVNNNVQPNNNVNNNVQPTTNVNTQPAINNVQPKETTALEKFKNGLSAATTVASSAIAEPVSGIGGILATAGAATAKKWLELTGIDPLELGKDLKLETTDASKIGTDVINSIKNSLTVNPNAGATEILSDLANSDVIKYISEASENGAKAAGDYLYEIGGKIGGEEGKAIGGALGKTLVKGAELAVGGLVGKAAEKGVLATANAAKAITSKLPEDAANIIKLAEQKNLKLQTSDLLDETKGVVAQHLQTLNERIPLVGTGAARVKQQVARENILKDIKDEFGIENNSNFDSLIVDNIKAESLKKLELARTKRNEALSVLDTKGKVSTSGARKVIEDIIDKESSVGVGKVIDKDTIDFLTDINNSIKSKTFSELASTRSRLINKIKTVERSEDKGGIGSLQRAKSAIDRQMKGFADSKDKDAAAKWNSQNADFANELEMIKNTAIKKIVEKGDFDKDAVLPLIRSANQGELNALKKSVDKNGLELIKSAIIKDVFDRTGGVDAINPDSFVTNMMKIKTDRNLRTFFSDTDKAKIDGLVKLLDRTRQAQKATSAPRTGDNILTLGSLGVGGTAVATGTILQTLAAAGTVKGINMIYNSAPMRNFLIKLAKAKKGSPEEIKLIKEAGKFLPQADAIKDNKNKEQK